MESTVCSVCCDGGYLDCNIYCDCAAGAFYESRDELSLQILLNELDNGYASVDEDWFNEQRLEYKSLELLSALPFYDGIRIADDTEYDDSSDDEYYDMRANSPWISDYEWDIHENGDCAYPCDACAYEDSTW